ncbi:MAG: hypothetical protein D6793_03045 [Thermoflexia bacterium]|nr:MAG: hypothetical protein D6793_03045 [Thermoflexia bacterium]
MPLLWVPLSRRGGAENLPWTPLYIELEADPLTDIPHLPGTVVGLRIPLGPQVVETVLEAVRREVAVVHLCADAVGRDTSGRPIPDALQEIHQALVRAALRDRVTLVVSGGIAAAEHVVKSIACGADLVAIDDILLVAWGCALWADRGRCPVETEEIPPEWARSA